MNIKETFSEELEKLKVSGNFRSLPEIAHEGKYIISRDRKMLDFSSNDYLGIAAEGKLWKEFSDSTDIRRELPSSSSSRLLTGNFPEFRALEARLAGLFGKEGNSLILADKLVHASIIDGIRLSGAKYIRYRHNDYVQLQRLVEDNAAGFRKIFIVTESIFSMDGDEADLARLVDLKHRYGNIMLYVDEAHAFGTRGDNGCGCAEEQGVTDEIDLLVGTFGKAAASAGAYVVCDGLIREYLINRMRTLIFSTALPPLNIKWTDFVISRLPGMKNERERLREISGYFRERLAAKGFSSPSTSHIIPIITGDSQAAVLKAGALQVAGFYVLPVRPPTVPAGSSRLRLSLTANMGKTEIDTLSELL